MSFKTLSVAVAATFLAMPALADITVMDAYARSSGKNAKSGAAFMAIQNTGQEDDHLVAAVSDVAHKVELHTHIASGDGVMRMVHVEEGFIIPAGETYMLKRGGDHVMFMGLAQPMHDGDMLDVTLVFEKAGEITVQIPVDLQRKPDHAAMDHSKMKTN